MFIRDEFGQWTFVPKGLCFIEGEGGDAAGGGGAEGDQGGESNGGDEGAGSGSEASGESEGTGSGDQGGGSPESTDGAEDWRAGIEDERIKTYAKTFTSPIEMATEAFKARQAASRSVLKPSKDATEEEMVAYRKAIGVPEQASDYKVSLPADLPEDLVPADDDAAINSYKEYAHQRNMPQDHFNDNISWYLGQLAAQGQQEAKEMEATQAEQRRALEQDWGKDYQANTEFAVRAARGIGGDEFVDFMDTVQVDGVRLGDHPSFLKPWAKVGRMMSESDPLIGVTAEEAQSLKDEHHELSGKILDARDRGDNAEVQRLTRQRDGLNAKLGKDEAVVGSAGRTL